MQLFNLVLGSKSLVRRACPVKRAARNGVEWRVRPFYTGDIFAAAVSERRLCANQSKEACDGESPDENLVQVDLLLFFDLQLISELFICEILCRPVYAHADEPRLNKFPVFEYFFVFSEDSAARQFVATCSEIVPSFRTSRGVAPKRRLNERLK